MAQVRSYKDLVVWQKAMDICVDIYQATKQFPPSENYGLTSQIRRSAVSIASNIAEGHARPRRDFARFLQIAIGSLNELETQCELAHRIGFLPLEKHANLTNDLSILGKQVNALRNKIRG